MRYLVGLVLAIAAFIALVYWSIQYPGITLVSWNSEPTHIIQGRTAAFILYIGLAFLALHLALNAIYGLLGLRQRLKKYYRQRTLARGLVKLTEGNWSRAEKLLLHQIDAADTPMVSYIAAARAAHMQEAYDRRDEWLRQALQHDSSARLAVGVSQADMQITAQQFEQAYATLINLQQTYPKHPYVLKLLARVLYFRESWDELLALLPELLAQKVLKPEDMYKVEKATLEGLFEKQLKEGGSPKLKNLWQRLPSEVTLHPEAIYLYAQSLMKAQDYITSAEWLETNLNQFWSDKLADLYGRIPQPNLDQALRNAQQWQSTQGNNPVLLLMMARLYKQQSNNALAKHYYESSVNQAPNAEAYLELAELLKELGETNNAQQTYAVGLRYAIHKKGERLILLSNE
ncbi:MAG: hypothetical protein RLZZ422_1965 [Pseudomonadota bacterium]|jgi:HemY protein